MLGARNISITKRLTRMNMLVSGAALVTACVAFIAYDVLTFREAIAYNLSIQAQIAGASSVSALLFNDPRSATATLSVLKAAPDVISAGIYAHDGQPFAEYWRDHAGEPPTLPPIREGQSEAHWFKDGKVVMVRSIVFQGKPTGTVYIQSDLQRLNARLKQYVIISAAVLGGSLLAALFLSSIFRRSTAEPIVHLAEIAGIVSRDKNYSVRATTTDNRDEVSLLITAFNEMLSQIQERDGALQEAHDELEQRVHERTAELTTANKELESFSYSVSHDLRAPLRSIDGFSQALLEDCGDRLDDQGKEHLNRVRAATQRMGILIDDLLNLSRIVRSEMHTQRFDISALACSIAADLQESQPERQVEFRIEHRLEAVADPGLLQNVLENLLGNAWKFTSKRASACIEFGQVHLNGTSAYFVRDDGAGFDQAYSQRLFGAFQRLHTETEFPGTGVGLATVQRIVHRHGGRIWVESAVDQGATFYFTLAESAS
jgi:signal transduction histidine kinase